MNKKAIVLTFLVSLVLAIILFVPACVFASDAFRISTQAGNSFTKFVTIVNEFQQKAKIGEQSSETLILDRSTAVVFYNPQVTQVEIAINGDKYNFQRASQCDMNSSCLCLHQKVNMEEELLLPQKSTCYLLDYQLELNDCTPPGNEDIATCSNGFIIAREVGDLQGLRRANVNMIKEADKIKLILK